VIKTNYSKGAEWRKWDLHVHTPLSICQNYGSNDGETWNEYIEDLESLPEDFAVIGVNDYLFVDGYEKLLLEQENNKKLQNLVLLPVVEFRIEKFAGIDFGNLKRMNLHVIFSNEVALETIKSQFLNTLEQSYTLESGEKWTRAITRDSVEDLGRTIKSNVPESELPKYGSDLTEGFNNLNVKEEQVFKSLQKDCFKDKFLIAIGKTEWADLKWTDSSIATKKTIINDADLVFTSAESIESFLRAKKQLTSQGVNDLLLDCSDAHSFSSSEDKDRIGKCYTWLKADPTFEGLKQVLNEPDERIYIGERPPLFDRVVKNRTKYIKRLSINHVDGYSDESNVWFEDISIPFSSELVAIIGNKGSGKSAIADILALCSNYYVNDDFSFLTDKKFREKKGKLAKNFEAVLTWESGNEDKRTLSDTPESTEVSGVKYLPQGRFERLTNEISTAIEFQNEIESVVFSHIPEAENLGALSFKELIEKKTVSVNAELEGLYADIKSKNESIIKLEQKATGSYFVIIENKLKKKNQELDALEAPALVSDPNKDPQKQKLHEAVNKRISRIRGEIRKIEGEIEVTKNKKKVVAEIIQKLEDAKSGIKIKQRELIKFKNDIAESVSDLGVDVNKIISIQTDLTQLDQVLATNKSTLTHLESLLGEEVGDLDGASQETLYEQLHKNENNLKVEKGKLDSEQQSYQVFITAKEIWEKERNSIIGAADLPGTIRFYEAELKFLKEELPKELEKKYSERNEVVSSIFDKKQEVIATYKTARNRLNSIIEKNLSTLKDYKIEVDASLVQSSDFNSIFLSHILQNKAGTFHSKDGAEKQLRSLVAEIDFDSKDSLLSFLDSIVESLHHDKRKGQNCESREVVQQVKDVQELYDYLFSLSFLVNNYQLKQGDKIIDQLSPGERGALLLVFYLLLDKRDTPLIIDQPEDNLDNHSIATVLVPFIRAAKKKRQIIMVTHNPNLAVVSDAEQVIYVELDKKNGYKFTTISGSIENREINQEIVNVLEGAMPAFNTRKRKYYE